MGPSGPSRRWSRRRGPGRGGRQGGRSTIVSLTIPSRGGWVASAWTAGSVVKRPNRNDFRGRGSDVHENRINGQAGAGGELLQPRYLARAEGEVERAEVGGQRGRVEDLPAGRGGRHLLDVGERVVPAAQEGGVDVLDQPGVRLGVLAPRGPDGEDHGQPGPLAP